MHVAMIGTGYGGACFPKDTLARVHTARDAPRLDNMLTLIEGGATVRAFDPEGMDEAKQMLSGVEWCDDAYAYATMGSADALVIITECNAFRGLDLERVKDLPKVPVMVDLGNIYEPKEMAALGFSYHCTGCQTS